MNDLFDPSLIARCLMAISPEPSGLHENSRNDELLFLILNGFIWGEGRIFLDLG
jgi:hypothetical protein